MPVFLRQSVLEPVQFNGQFCGRTIEIENVISSWMLAAEFESRKAPGPQGAPQLLFFVCLFATETAGAGGRIHRNNVDENFAMATGR